MKRVFLSLVLALFCMGLVAQPAHYYDDANGLTGNELKTALHNIIKDHTSISYAQIWNAFWSTDNKGNGKVWDMYSDVPNGTPPYVFALGNDQCGNYSGEGDCYNREHSWPQSWFNEQSTPRTDLHHIFATDGYVNGRRSNYPFGEVRSATWTSRNGSKLGSSMTPGYSGTVFEPIDEYKGDFARALMYMSVRYYGEDGSWSSSEMTNKAQIKDWAIAMLLRWHEADPVSQKEIDRNNAIYDDYQHNRNPFIDCPEFANMIWDPDWQVEENTAGDAPVYVFPNPVARGGELHISGNQWQFDALIICDLCGHKLMKASGPSVGGFSILIPGDLQPGCYFVKMMKGERVVKNLKLIVK